jgi:hypothetical protein
MKIHDLHLKLRVAIGHRPVPVAVQDAINDVLASRVHATADSRLRDVIVALEVDGSRPDLIVKFKAILKEDTCRPTTAVSTTSARRAS